MAFEEVLSVSDLPKGSKQCVQAGDTEILLIHAEDGQLHAVESKCPHAGAPLEKGAVCNGRLVCPWHGGTFELGTGALVEPPPLRSLKTYPVQVSGDRISVDTVPSNEPTLASHGEHRRVSPFGEHLHFATIGAGAAATAAVCTLRQEGFAGRITMIDPRPPEPVDRTLLSKMALSGQKPLDTLGLLTPEDQKALRIDRLVARVDTLQGDQGLLRMNDGEGFGFDAALLAPGGIPKWLDIEGEDQRHVFTIRHLKDVEAIDALMKTQKHTQAVVVGDSFIAFEAASALKTRGATVTVVSRSPQPFSKKFGESPAQAILGLHQAKGVQLRLGAEAREIGATEVVLKSGETVPANLVLIAVGVQPATDFELDAELDAAGLIAVDASLKAGSKLWVAGDIAKVEGVHIEHWRTAEQHGRAAALAIAAEHSGGEAQAFHGVPFFWTTHFGKRFGYVGHAEKWDDLQVDGSLGDASFLAYYVAGGRVKAVFGCGKDAAIAMLAERMRGPLTLEQARAAAGAA